MDTMTTEYIIKALRRLATLPEDPNLKEALGEHSKNVLREAADRLEQMVKLSKDLDMLRAHMDCFTEDAERWIDLATCGRWPIPKKTDTPNSGRPTSMAEMRHRQYEGFGELHTNAQWAERLGLPRNTMARYFSKGMTVEEIVEMRGIDYPRNDPES